MPKSTSRTRRGIAGSPFRLLQAVDTNGTGRSDATQISREDEQPQCELAIVAGDGRALRCHPRPLFFCDPIGRNTQPTDKTRWWLSVSHCGPVRRMREN